MASPATTGSTPLTSSEPHITTANGTYAQPRRTPFARMANMTANAATATTMGSTVMSSL